MHVVKIQLPSRGKYGDSHIGLINPTVDIIRSFLAFEGKNVIAINNLVKSVCDVEVDGLPTGDRDYLYMNIRNMVNPNPISGSLPCSGCDHKTVFNIQAKDLEIKQLPDDFVKDAKITLPVSKKEVVINVLTVKAEEEVIEYVGLHDTADTPMTHSELGKDLYEFAKYAALIEVEKKNLTEKIQFVRDLDFADFEVLILYEVLFKCGPVLDHTIKCENCQKEHKINIPLDSSFLGISLSTLLTKHRFLSKVSNIGFQDFLKYSLGELDVVVSKELELKTKSKKK